MTKELSFAFALPNKIQRSYRDSPKSRLDCVAGGASIGFMQPLSYERALSFWQAVPSAVARVNGWCLSRKTWRRSKSSGRCSLFFTCQTTSRIAPMLPRCRSTAWPVAVA